MANYMDELHYWSEKESLWKNLKGSTIMISGATGMIGKCLVDLFMMYNAGTVPCQTSESQDTGVKVIALSRNESSARERLGDYWDSPWFQYVSCNVNAVVPECGRVDYIIHAASNTHPRLYSQDPIGTIASNVFGTRNLLDYGVSHGIRQFCFVSSVEVYGENRGDTEKFDESYLGFLDCNTLRAGYPESKRLGEALCNAYGEACGMGFVIPRLSRVYGPTMLMSDTKAISQFLKKAAAGEDIVLKSEGNQKYSYAFVTDAAAGILWTMVFGALKEAYNVADEQSDITLKGLAEILAGIGGSKVVFELPEERERKGYSTATRAMLSTEKIRALGWEARIHMKEGLLQTVEAWKREAAAITDIQV